MNIQKHNHQVINEKVPSNTLAINKDATSPLSTAVTVVSNKFKYLEDITYRKLDISSNINGPMYCMAVQQ